VANYLVVYDLNAPGKDYARLIKHLTAYPTRWHFQKSAWIVGPADSAMAVAEAAWTHMDQNDKLFVQAVTEDCAWGGYDQQGTDFLRSI